MTTELPTHGDIIYLELGQPQKQNYRKICFCIYFFTFVVDKPFYFSSFGISQTGIGFILCCVALLSFR